MFFMWRVQSSRQKRVHLPTPYWIIFSVALVSSLWFISMPFFIVFLLPLVFFGETSNLVPSNIDWMDSSEFDFLFLRKYPRLREFLDRVLRSTHTKCHRAKRWMNKKQFINCRPWHHILWLHCCASHSRLTSSLISSKLSEFFFRFSSVVISPPDVLRLHIFTSAKWPHVEKT